MRVSILRPRIERVCPPMPPAGCAPRAGGATVGVSIRLPVAALVALVLAGCARAPIGAAGRGTPAAARAGATMDDARAWEVQRPVAKDTAEAAHPGSKTSAAPATVLPAYAVRETAFSDFGMSVKTNFDVQWGGHVAWMVVTAIDAGSSAAQRRLGVGDRILAIDGRQITAFDRDAMLAALFHRSPGQTSRLLVLGPKEALPRFVTLVARRP